MNRFPQYPLPKDDFTGMTFNLNFNNFEEKSNILIDKDLEINQSPKDILPKSAFQLYSLNSANNISIEKRPSVYSKYSDYNIMSSINLGSYRKVTLETNDSSTNILKLQIFDIEIQKIKNTKYKSKTNTFKIKEKEIPVCDKNYSKELLKVLASPYSESEIILNNYYNEMKSLLCLKDTTKNLPFINKANNSITSKVKQSMNIVNDNKLSTQCDNETLDSK